MLSVHVSSITNAGIKTFWAQKIALRKSMKLKRFMTFNNK